MVRAMRFVECRFYAEWLGIATAPASALNLDESKLTRNEDQGTPTITTAAGSAGSGAHEYWTLWRMVCDGAASELTLINNVRYRRRVPGAAPRNS